MWNHPHAPLESPNLIYSYYQPSYDMIRPSSLPILPFTEIDRPSTSMSCSSAYNLEYQKSFHPTKEPSHSTNGHERRDSGIALDESGKMPKLPRYAFVQVDTPDGPMFQCTEPGCDKKYKVRGTNAKSHWLTHNSIMPFPCKICSKRFTRKNDCIRHEKLHDKERNL